MCAYTPHGQEAAWHTQDSYGSFMPASASFLRISILCQPHPLSPEAPTSRWPFILYPWPALSLSVRARPTATPASRRQCFLCRKASHFEACVPPVQPRPPCRHPAGHPFSRPPSHLYNTRSPAHPASYPFSTKPASPFSPRASHPDLRPAHPHPAARPFPFPHQVRHLFSVTLAPRRPQRHRQKDNCVTGIDLLKT